MLGLPAWDTNAAAQALDAASDVQVQEDVIVLSPTLEAMPGYLRVYAQLRQDGEVVEGQAQQLSGLPGLADIGGDLDAMLGTAGQATSYFPVFLDTGASGHVLSLSTAQRFGIKPAPDAVFHEFGLHGEVPMGVSEPYTLALAGSTGRLSEEVRQFTVVNDDARFQLNQKRPSNPLIEMALGEINVIGMPAIRDLVVEVDPAPLLGVGDALDALGQGGLEDIDALLDNIENIGVGPAVHLHEADHQPQGVDAVVQLEYVNYSRRENPKNRGPLPTLAENPTFKGLESRHGEKTFRGDWLLDTGAPASIVSTTQAKALGLLDEQGNPTQAPAFSLPLGGVGGEVTPTQGFRIDALRIQTTDGRTLEYRNVHVLVKDISAELDDGSTITLDGVFGTNLLLPSVAGLSFGFPTNIANGPFKRVWIDGPRGQLLLDLPEAEAIEQPEPFEEQDLMLEPIGTR